MANGQANAPSLPDREAITRREHYGKASYAIHPTEPDNAPIEPVLRGACRPERLFLDKAVNESFPP